MHLKSLQPLPHLTVQKGILQQKDLDISWQAAKEPTQKNLVLLSYNLQEMIGELFLQLWFAQIPEKGNHQEQDRGPAQVPNWYSPIHNNPIHPLVMFLNLHSQACIKHTKYSLRSEMKKCVCKIVRNTLPWRYPKLDIFDY